MNTQYLQLLQKRIGSTSVGPSTARGMGPSGTIQAARRYLQTLDIARFVRRNETAFRSELDAATLELQKFLPKDARNWGSARKFLNIFLRDCAYNKYLCERFRLEKIESWLELPMDSHVAKGLKREGKRGELPRWRTVIGLTPSENSAYQVFASSVAEQEGVLRAHLDVKYWRRDKPNASVVRTSPGKPGDASHVKR